MIRIKAGFDLVYECACPTPMVLMLNLHPSRAHDLLTEARLHVSPVVPIKDFTDGFGNRATRIVAPIGKTTISTRFEFVDSGQPDHVAPWARQHSIDVLPVEILVFLNGSRYCETDELMDFA